MPINIGTEGVGRILVGTSAVGKVYVGADLVWSANKLPTGMISLLSGSHSPSVGNPTTLQALYTDPDGHALTYQWQFSDPQGEEVPYNNAGPFEPKGTYDGTADGISATAEGYIGTTGGPPNTIRVPVPTADTDYYLAVWTTSDRSGDPDAIFIIDHDFGTSSIGVTGFTPFVDPDDYQTIVDSLTPVSTDRYELPHDRYEVQEIEHVYNSIAGETESTLEISVTEVGGEDVFEDGFGVGNYRVQVSDGIETVNSNEIEVGGPYDLFANTVGLSITIVAHTSGTIISLNATSGLSALADSYSGFTWTFEDGGDSFTLGGTFDMNVSGAITDTAVTYNAGTDVVTVANGFDASSVPGGGSTTTFNRNYTNITAATLTP